MTAFGAVGEGQAPDGEVKEASKVEEGDVNEAVPTF